MIVIWLPLLNSIGGFIVFEKTNENRSFKDSLSINISKLDAFPKDANEYVNDNFSFRTPLLRLYHYHKYALFSISPHPEKTVIGKNGWFFVTGKEVEIYEGKKEFSETQLQQLEDIWAYRKHYLDSLSIISYWVLNPMKHQIYSEFLPSNIIRKKGPSRVEILKTRLNKKFPGLVIHPKEDLLRAKDSLLLYRKLDNHWSSQAGFVVSSLILQKIKIDFPEITISKYQDFTWKDSLVYNGFHRNVMGIESLVEHDIFPFPKNEKSFTSSIYNFPVTDGFPYPYEFEKVFRNENDTTLPKILIIRDSFGDLLIPFLKEPFSESVFIFDGWRYGLNKEIIETIKPDIVIFLGLETHIENIFEFSPITQSKK